MEYYVESGVQGGLAYKTLSPRFRAINATFSCAQGTGNPGRGLDRVGDAEAPSGIQDKGAKVGTAGNFPGVQMQNRRFDGNVLRMGPAEAGRGNVNGAICAGLVERTPKADIGGCPGGLKPPFFEGLKPPA